MMLLKCTILVVFDSFTLRRLSTKHLIARVMSTDRPDVAIELYRRVIRMVSILRVVAMIGVLFLQQYLPTPDEVMIQFTLRDEHDMCVVAVVVVVGFEVLWRAGCPVRLLWSHLLVLRTFDDFMATNHAFMLQQPQPHPVFIALIWIDCFLRIGDIVLYTATGLAFIFNEIVVNVRVVVERVEAVQRLRNEQ